MSGRGEPTEVHLIGPAMVRLVGAVPQVQTLLREPVIVGGLAVMSRLSTAYRATEDLDALRLREAGEASGLEILQAAGAKDMNEVGGLLETAQGDVRVDVLEARPSDLDRAFSDATDRLEAMAHDWTLRSATSMKITATRLDAQRAGGALAEPQGVTAVALVARPGPLVAMKLKAAADRMTQKEATDLLDVVRLVTGPESAEAVLDDFTHADTQLIEDVKLHAGLKFTTQRSRTVRIISALNRQDVDVELIDAAGEFIAGI